ncbi:K(+)-transporting ATPase subunit F [Photorhabdus temperata]
MSIFLISGALLVALLLVYLIYALLHAEDFLNGIIRFFTDRKFLTNFTAAGKTAWQYYRQYDQR